METTTTTELKQCKRCGELKPLDAFTQGQRYTRCKACRAADERERRNANPEAFRQRERQKRERTPLAVLYRDAQKRAKRSGIEFEITPEYLKTLYEQCDGCCVVTGLPFDCRRSDDYARAPYRPSLDRIDNRKGYVFGNCRLVLWFVNQAMGEYGLDAFLKVARATVETSGVCGQLAAAFAAAESVTEASAQ